MEYPIKIQYKEEVEIENLFEYLKLLRIKHWIKNILIAITAFFGGEIFEIPVLLKIIPGFFAFSFYASAIYIINDLSDIENDRTHPVKCNRPLAKGTVTKRGAYILVAFMLLSAVGLSLIPNGFSIYIMIPFIFFVLNLLYSLRLKKVALVDVIILVSGYLLRVFYGSLITAVSISGWLYLAVTSISFFLALGKRRGEKLCSPDSSREVLSSYSMDFLTNNMYLYLTLFIAFYALWSMNDSRIWTTPLIMVILLRYSYRLETDSDGDPVTLILSDWMIWLFGLIYCVLMLILAYFPGVTA